MDRILIIKHGALGDVALALGTFASIKRENEDAEMWLVTTGGMLSFVRATGLFSGYVVDNRGGVMATWCVLRRIAEGGFSMIYDFQQSQRAEAYRRVLRRMLPPGEYQWIDTKNESLITLTKKIRWGIGRIRRMDAQIPWTRTDLSQMQAEGKHFDMLPKEPYILLIPGCSPNNLYKRWDVRNFCEIADNLGKKGIRVVVLGTADEAATCNAIAQGRDWVVNMVGLTSLTDIPQVAMRSIGVLGNDTGPTHIAALTGRYTLGLFDQRNERSAHRNACCDSIVSSGGVNLISVDEVRNRLAMHLPQVSFSTSREQQIMNGTEQRNTG